MSELNPSVEIKSDLSVSLDSNDRQQHSPQQWNQLNQHMRLIMARYSVRQHRQPDTEQENALNGQINVLERELGGQPCISERGITINSPRP